MTGCCIEDCTKKARFQVSVDTGALKQYCGHHTLSSMRGWLQQVWKYNRAVYIQRYVSR